MAFTKEDISSAFAASFPQLGTVEDVIAVMEGVRSAYRVITTEGEYFVKNVPPGARRTPEENMGIQKELYDADVPVVKPVGLMTAGDSTFTVEEFCDAQYIERPQLQHKIQVAQALAKQHAATQLPEDAIVPRHKAHAQIDTLRDNFQRVFTQFEDEGIPKENWEAALTDRFMSQFDRHGLAHLVEDQPTFGDSALPARERFRQAAAQIAHMVVKEGAVDYICDTFYNLEKSQTEHAAEIHRSRLHEDPNTGNVLYDGSGKLVALIDYEYSQLGPSYMDLGAAIKTQISGKKIDWEEASQMVSAYHQIRPLSAKEVELLPASIHVRTALLSALRLIEFSKVLGDNPPDYLKNPVPYLKDLEKEKTEIKQVEDKHLLFPRDLPQKEVLRTFLPYLNTRKFHPSPEYEDPKVETLLDAVEKFLRREKITIAYDPSLPAQPIPDDFGNVAGLVTFRLNSRPKLHNQPPLAQYQLDNSSYQRNLGDLMLAVASYCVAEKAGHPVDLKQEDIIPSFGLSARAPDDANAFHKLSKAEYPRFDKPVVFGVWGLGVQENCSQDFIDEGIRRADHLSQKAGNMDYYFLTYPQQPMALYSAYGNQYNQDPEHYYSETAMQFVQDVLMPAVSPRYTPAHPQAHRYRKEDENAVVSGERYNDIEQVRQQLGNIRFVAHSYGTCFVQEVRNALVRSMKDLGYAQEEIRETLPAVFSLNTGTLVQTDIQKTEGSFSQFSIVAKDDIVANNCSNHLRQLKEIPQDDCTLSSPDTHTVNAYSNIITGQLFASPEDQEPIVWKANPHEWEAYWYDGYNAAGQHLDNSSLPGHVLQKAIEKGASIAQDGVPSLLPSQEHIHSIEARPAGEWTARAANTAESGIAGRRAG